MTGRIPWFQRTFSFDYPWELYPELIERLRGTPVRAQALVANMTQDVLTQRVGDRWSIQENIAHLADLDEILIIPRMKEFEQGLETLLAADLENKTTNNARHNERSISEVLDRFATVRGGFIRRLESLSHEMFGRSALHPRLKKQMRLTDLVCFDAEHDDYHMAHITQIKRELGA